MTHLWEFRPLDTLLFFRNSTPFEAGEIDMVQPESMFPPLMNPLQGAIRTSLAAQRGWSPHSEQTPFPPELGDEHHLGLLQMKGPFLAEHGKTLVPLPLTLFGKIMEDRKTKKEIWQIQPLVPGPPSYTDLNQKINHPLRLLEPAERVAGGKLLELWGTMEALASVLRGEIPDFSQLRRSSDLWRKEQKHGIMRGDIYEKRVKGGHLYTSVHIRLNKGVTLQVEVKGIPADWEIKEKLALPLGGEGRFADVRIRSDSFRLPEVPNLQPAPDGKLRYTLSLLTPGRWKADKLPDVIHYGPPSAPGTCIAASIGKIWRVGGWDLKEKGPREVIPLLPPGCTWFFEASMQEKEKIERLHGKWVGENNAFGMGQVVIGTWKEGEEAE
ncbi:type III-B CRISPR module-associated Cmr3 family protein [Thermoflavimicrobium dichotomicum]|uniref:CRISPR-associated protein Cmr3 n=1 Tax=Thermoflavimicrobium dichotomicum TaxID=46223 RepID=A0A1I3T5A3_9BACL|nr:type III-B CRISPR module-associated Cmr3 family protein [Thermoflavimicrobium dichotomicum]SFJ66244.1 CRISPR-associated protein Cmr3 [Thermoflavimicrobium dichotomicum]